MGIGYLIDRQFDTFPAFLLGGAVLGFAAFVLRLWRLGRELQEPGADGESQRKR